MNNECIICKKETKLGRKTCSGECRRYVHCLKLLDKNKSSRFYLLDLNYLLFKYGPSEAFSRYKYYKTFFQFFRNNDIPNIVSYEEYLNVISKIEQMSLSLKNIGQPNRKERWIQYGFTEDSAKKISKFYSTHKDSFLIRYSDGNDRYNKWIEKVKSNKTDTFGEKSYFSPKYWIAKGFSVEDSNKLSKNINTRNLEYFTKKYGDEVGKIKYNEMIIKRIETNKKENMIKKHGIDKYNEIIKNKTINLDKFVKKYGEELGKIKYHEYTKKRLSYCLKSKIAIQFEQDLKNKLNNKKLLEDEVGIDGKLFDYKYEKYLIEINGDWWHMNPLIYNKNSTQFNNSANVIWKTDKEKIKLGKNNGYFIIVIWENAIRKKIKEVVDIVSNIINNNIEKSISINYDKYNLIKENI